MTRLVLASGSAIRQHLLRDAGLTFEVEKARVDEDALKAALLEENQSPREIADLLAEAKAVKVSAKLPGSLVIGADQVLSLDGQILSKPENQSEARAQLQSLSGKTHHLYSAAVIAEDGAPIWRHVSTVRMTMRNMSGEFLDRYLSDAGPDILQSVGAYKFEAEGVRLFSKVEGPYHAILGLPLIELLNFLTVAGHIAK